MLNPDSPAGNAGPVIDSKELLKGYPFIRITHEGETYLLRVTKSNKLILTK